MPDATKVHVYDDATLLGTVNVDGSGNWSKTGQTLAAGVHKIKGKAEDVAGNLSAFSQIKNIYTGCTATPVCDLLDDSGQSSVDNITNDNTPRIMAVLDLSAMASAMGVGVDIFSIASMKLYEKTGPSTYVIVGTETDIDDAGSDMFSATFQINTALSDGVHTFVATWTDRKGNESAKGAELAITIDTAAPNAPVITNLYNGQVFIGTSIDIAGTAS